MNSLIAKMGDSFDKVMNNLDKYDMITKIDMLLQLNDIFFWKRLETFKWLNLSKYAKAKNMKFFHIIQYVTQNDESDEWAGKIKSISKSQERIGDKISKEVKGVRQEVR